MRRSGTSLSRDLERKIHERLVSLKDTIQQTEIEEWPVSTRRAIQFVQERDMSLRRIKKPILEKVVEKVLDTLKAEVEEKLASSQDLVLVDSDMEEQSDSNLMEVKVCFAALLHFYENHFY